ncbi:5742_t:CDS:2 [Diversispora eburnea]|uniref:5742_t:CDS:1 n=1 Tax=Diversispora eburnea TaxID=1213867 RepID=A0A9N8V344_9GLOM|nr:5742_t:CDS:2 [Diversispora eburnea]
MHNMIIIDVDYNRNAYVFPILPDADIVQFLEQVVEGFTDQDVKKPTVQRLNLVYDAILRVTTGVTKEEWGNKDWNDHLENRLHNKIDNAEELLEKSEELVNRYNTLVEKVNELKSQRKEQENEVKVYMQQNANLMSGMRELKKKQTGLLNEIATLKNIRVDWTEKINNTHFLVVTAKQVLEKLKSRIVLNPEKLKQTIEEMNETMAREKETMLGLDKKVRDIQTKFDMLTIVEEEIISCNKMLDDAINQRIKADKANKDFRDLQAEAENKRQFLREYVKKEQIISRQKLNLEERTQRLREKHNQRMAETEKKYTALQAEYEKILEERKEIELKAAEEKNIYNETLAKCNDLVQAWNKEKAEVESEFKALKDRIEGYHQEIILTCRVHKIFTDKAPNF